MNEQEIISLLEKRIAKHADQNIEKYIQKVAVWISRIHLSHTKTEITFKYDPPWDSSGQIYNTGSSFNISDYSTLNSFINKEFTGTSHASYVSGIGIFHNLYSDELDELTDNWITLQLNETVEILLSEKNDLIIEYAKLRGFENRITHNFHYKTTEEYSELMYADDIIGDFLLINYPIELKRRIGQMDIKFLFKLGHNHAIEELKKEETARQSKREEQIINQNKAAKCWNNICKLHSIRYQKDMPQKIDKDYYDKYLYPLLIEEFKDNDAILEIRLLGKFMGHKFSNSVARKLIDYN